MWFVTLLCFDNSNGSVHLECSTRTKCVMQVVPGIDQKKASADSVSLVEVGPRVCLNPIKIFGGSFGGPVLFDNPHFVSPNRVSATLFCCILLAVCPACIAMRKQSL